jgi:hypothetical protein
MMKSINNGRALMSWIAVAIALCLGLVGCGGEGGYTQRIVTFTATWDATSSFAGMQLETDEGRACNLDGCSYADFGRYNSGLTTRDRIELATRESEDPYRILLRNDGGFLRDFDVRVYFGTLESGRLEFDETVSVPADSIYEVLIYRNGRISTTFVPRSPSKAPLPTGVGWKTAP